jgi:hypothetical protein
VACPSNDSAMGILISLNASHTTLVMMLAFAIAAYRKLRLFDISDKKDDALRCSHESNNYFRKEIFRIDQVLIEGLGTAMDTSRNIFDMSSRVKTRSMPQNTILTY